MPSSVAPAAGDPSAGVRSATDDDPAPSAATGAGVASAVDMAGSATFEPPPPASHAPIGAASAHGEGLAAGQAAPSQLEPAPSRSAASQAAGATAEAQSGAASETGHSETAASGVALSGIGVTAPAEVDPLSRGPQAAEASAPSPTPESLAGIPGLGTPEAYDRAEPAADGATAAAPAPRPAPPLTEKAARLVSRLDPALHPRTPLTVRAEKARYGRGTIVIDTSERRLLYFYEEEEALEFPVGVGRPGLQRVGQTRITLKRRDPTWIPTRLQHRVYRHLPAVVPPGPDNPLGTRALNLGINMIRIHGTNDDTVVGHQKSDGCFRMYNEDIEFLFELVSVGTRVVILR